MPSATSIRLQNIVKYYGKHAVLKNINLEFESGRIYCVLGENGAGKSTLAKVISGITSFDSGNIKIAGNQISRLSPSKASKLGIRIACQENYLFDNLTVTENILINNELTHNHISIINNSLNNKKARIILDSLNININEKKYIKNLSLPECKLVEIAKSFYNNPDYIILDEPTAPLGITETENIIKTIFEAKKRGACIIYITHIIEDVFKIADQVIIMNGGTVVVNKEFSDLDSSDYFLRSMAGEDYLNRYPKTKAKKGRPLLEVSNLYSSNGAAENINLTLKAGEILGLAGLQGAGKSTVAKMLFGLEKAQNGTIRVDNENIKIKKPGNAIEKGIAYIGDETQKGIFPSLSLIENIMLMSYKKFLNRGLLKSRKINREARESMHYFHMNVKNPAAKIKKQSVGTIQKSNICRWALLNSKIYLMDDPTQSLDIPSKVEIYNLMNRIAHSDSGILLISSDISELVGMCDRILVMYEGEIIKEINSEDCTSKDILDYSFGNV